MGAELPQAHADVLSVKVFPAHPHPAFSTRLFCKPGHENVKGLKESQEPHFLFSQQEINRSEVTPKTTSFRQYPAIYLARLLVAPPQGLTLPEPSKAHKSDPGRTP
jgi:hypothetical protein